MAKFPAEDWQVTQLRLTVFGAPRGGTPPLTEWWSAVAGTEPNQNITDRKRNFSVVSGDYENASLTLGLSLARVDWALGGAEGILDPGPAFQEIGPLPDRINGFSRLAETWLLREDLPEIARIAFGVVLHHPEADHSAAYIQLRDYIPVPVNPSWRDFTFQVNVHRDIQNPELGVRYINRLSKWVVLRNEGGTFVLGDGGIVTTPGIRSYSVRLELDVNTPAENADQIPRDQLVPIYRELVADATAIARDGVTNEQFRIG